MARRLQSVDQHADTVINWQHEADTNPAGLRILHAAHEPETEAIPRWLLDSPPTAELAVIPALEHRWEITWWVAVGAFTAGMVTMVLMLRYL